MSKSIIYTDNETAQVTAVGSTIGLGNVIRRFGQNLRLNGNAINVCGAGYYKIDANITIEATTAGTATISLVKDGVIYASRSVDLAVGNLVVVPLDVVIREYGCCCDNNSNLTFVLGGTAQTISQISVIVEKE